MNSTCVCQHCGQSIEFDVERGGEIVACPTCGKKTRLIVYVPISNAKLAELKLPESENKSGKRTSTFLLNFASAFIFVIGLGMVASGCFGSLDESLKNEGSAIRQIVYVGQYGIGFLLLAASFIIRALARHREAMSLNASSILRTATPSPANNCDAKLSSSINGTYIRSHPVILVNYKKILGTVLFKPT